MNKLNEHLQIPQELQAVLEQIENMPLHLAELKMQPHPKFPQYDRYLVVYGLEVDCFNEFVYFRYIQVLKDKETGEKIQTKLPTPEWVVYKEVWSYFRNSENKIVEAPLKPSEEEETTEIDRKVRVPSYKYMLWLMKYQNAQLLALIRGYAMEFMKSKQEELDKYETL